MLLSGSAEVNSEESLSMIYGITFMLLGVAAILSLRTVIALHWPAYWLSFSFIIIGLAYLSSSPRLLGKQKNGAMNPLPVLMLLPFFVLAWFVWHIQIRMTREDRFNEIIAGYILGRRLLPKELPAKIRSVVDVAAEFYEPSEIVKMTHYINCPMLDGSGCDLESFKKLIDEIERSGNGTYIHCAQGHGRSATVMAGILIKKGLVSNPEEAEEYIKLRRPGIRINKTQKKLLAEYQESLQISS